MANLITVFGVTGSQGGSVARALLADGTFKVRGVTRNPDSEKAQALKNAGAEVVKADLNDAASVEAAVSGAYGVFLVTNYWEFVDEQKEIVQGKTAVDACKKAGVKHVVFSGLELVKDILGKPCPHFDGKGRVEKYLDKQNVPNTSVRYAFYSENFVSPGFKPQDGTNEFTFPMYGPMDIVSVAECGPVVASVFNKPEEFIGKKIGLSGSKKTIAEYIAIINKVTGKTFTYNPMSYEDYAKLPFPAEDISAMFEFYSKCNPNRDIELTRRFNPNMLSFEEWVEKNKDKF